MNKLSCCLASLSLALAFLVPEKGVAAAAPFAVIHSLLDPGTNSQTDAQQGYSVALEGNLAVVGTPFADVGASDSGLVKIYQAASGALVRTLTNPRATAGDDFGTAVAISGTRVVVGAPSLHPFVSPSGLVYIYDLAGGVNAGVPVLTLTNPTPSFANRFGAAVAISGTRVIVGVPNDDSGAASAGSVYVYDLASGTPSLPLLKLNNPSPGANDEFGFAVAMSGSRAVVGAYDDNTGATNSGSAYAYDLAGATPATPVLTLTNPAPMALDQFGKAVGISMTRIVVGAPRDGAAGFQSGSAYIYDLAGATPAVPVITLVDPTPNAGAQFGGAVGLDGARVVVGALNHRAGTLATGSAYIYELSGGMPTVPVEVLTNPTPAEGDQFGFSVAISGTRVLAGAPGDDTRGHDAGSAYSFDLASGTPAVPVAVLNGAIPAANELFGSSVSVSGPWVVIGVPYDDTGALDAGVVYVYRLDGGATTVPFLTLTNPSPVTSAYFGFSVAISGTRVVVGVIYDDNGPTYAGSAYVYDMAGGTLGVPVWKLINPRPRQADYFGESVAISGSRIVVGAPYDSAAAFESGRAYIYNLAGATPNVATLTITNPSPAAEDYFGHDVSIAGNRVVIGAFGDDSGATNAGSVYVYDLGTATPAVPVVTLTNPSPEVNDWFGSALAISGTRVVVGAYGDRNGGFYSGSAYVYDVAGGTPSVPILILTNPTPAAGDSFGDAVGISGSRITVGAQGDDAAMMDAGVVYLYDLDGATPNIPVATLTHPNPGKSDQLGSAVAIDGTTIVVGAPFVDGTTLDRGAAYVFGLQPVLHIAPAAPGLVTIWWTAESAPGFVLQYTDTLTPANWMTVGTVNPITVPSSDASRFYRLFKP
ncbi:MAG: hypothetical protein QOF48_590 [Verrucomicrobiota bacterium]